MALGTSLPARLPVSSGARVFYVDAATGSDANAGTSEGAAWATLQDYFSGTAGPSNNIVPTAGDIVYVKNFPGQVSNGQSSVGYYNPAPDTNGDHVIDSKIGAVGNPITVKAFPGHRPVILGRQTPPAPGATITHCLRIRATSAYWRFEGLDFPYAAGAGANESCVYVTGTAHDIEFYDCWIHGATDGSGIFVDTSTSKVHLYNCKVWGNDDWRGGANQSHGIYIGGADQCVIANCISRDHVQGFGVQVRLGANQTWIVNSVFVRNKGAGSGIVIENDEITCIAKNNICVDNGNYGIRSLAGGTGGSGNRAHKNIASGNDVGHFANDSAVSTRWDWSAAGTGNYATPPDDNLTSDPLFVNEAGSDFRVQVGSPAIGYGDETYCPTFDIDGNPRTQVDAGAYRYVAAAGGKHRWLRPHVSLSL